MRTGILRYEDEEFKRHIKHKPVSCPGCFNKRIADIPPYVEVEAQLEEDFYPGFYPDFFAYCKRCHQEVGLAIVRNDKPIVHFS